MTGKCRICGLGTVWERNLQRYTRKRRSLRQSGCNIQITRHASEPPHRHRPRPGSFSTDVYDVVNDPAIDIVVEVIGATMPQRTGATAIIKTASTWLQPQA